MDGHKEVAFLAGVWLSLNKMQQKLEDLAAELHDKGYTDLSCHFLDTMNLEIWDDAMSLQGLRDMVEDKQTEISDKTGV